MRDFTKYDIWQDGIDFAKVIYLKIRSFPSEEKFGLISQLRRAAVSISSNFAEVCSRTSEKEFTRSIEISLGSAFEVSTQLAISSQLEFISKEDFKTTSDLVESISRRLNGLRNKLK